MSGITATETERRQASPAIEVSVVIPCLNEAETITECVAPPAPRSTTAASGARSSSPTTAPTDGAASWPRRPAPASSMEPRRGYGTAYLAGFAAARGEYIVMADADLTYDFAEIPRFVEQLEEGAELVMGDRMDNIHPGAMPWLHRYVGNPILTGVLNLFFRTGVSDAHCGMRACAATSCPRSTCARRAWSSPPRW